MGSISNFNLSSAIFYANQYPMTTGIVAATLHATIQGIVITKFKKPIDLVNQSNNDLNSVFSTAPSGLTKTFVKIKTFFSLSFVRPLYWELIFRDVIYTYVETNFANVNALAINFVMMPILFGALHFDPRQQLLLLVPIAFTSLGCLLALLRKATGGLRSSLVAQITNNLVLGCMIGVRAARNFKGAREKAE